MYFVRIYLHLFSSLINQKLEKLLIDVVVLGFVLVFLFVVLCSRWVEENFVNIYFVKKYFLQIVRFKYSDGEHCKFSINWKLVNLNYLTITFNQLITIAFSGQRHELYAQTIRKRCYTRGRTRQKLWPRATRTRFRCRSVASPMCCLGLAFMCHAFVMPLLLCSSSLHALLETSKQNFYSQLQIF